MPCTTIRNDAVLIPYRVVEIFCLFNNSGFAIDLEYFQTQMKRSTRHVSWGLRVCVCRYNWFTYWYAEIQQNLEDSISKNPTGISIPVKWKVYLIGGYRTLVFHPAFTQSLITKLPPFALCFKSSSASTMFNNSLVPSGECRLHTHFLMQCPTRCHDPGTVLVKVQWWFAVPFTDMFIHTINGTLPSCFLSSHLDTTYFLSLKTEII